MKTVPLRRLFVRQKILGFIDEPMLSVYRERGVVLKDETVNPNKTAEDRSIYQLVDEGWLVVNRMKAWQGSLGISAHRGIVSGHYICFRPAHAEIGRYLHYLLRSPFMTAHFASISRGVRPGQIEIDNDDLAATPIPLPSAEEQRRIADFLDDWVARIDWIIAARQRQSALMDDGARSELAYLALGGDRTMPLRYLILDEQLGMWGADAGVEDVDVQVARVADFRRPEFRLGDTPTLRSAKQSQVESRLLRHGDVLLERSGGTMRNPVGCPAFVESPASMTVCSNFVSRLRPRDDVDGRYLSLVLGALYATRQQAPHSTQTTGIMNLDSGSYFRTLVPARDHDQQVRLRAEMDDSLAETRKRQSELARSIELLTEYKSSLITAAVAGELDVTTAGSGIPA